MEPDDAEAEALRKQIREELGTVHPSKKRMGVGSIIFSTLCLLSPFAVYLALVWNSHGFKGIGEFFHWLMH